MNPELVLRKTDKGREEIATRTHRLDAKRRRVLIIVDGHSSAGRPRRKGRRHRRRRWTLLDALLAEGFIEAVGGAAAARSRPRPGPPRGAAGAGRACRPSPALDGPEAPGLQPDRDA